MKIRILSVLLLFSIILTGCSNIENKKNSTETNTSTQVSETSNDEKDLQKLTFSSMKGPTGISLAPLKEKDNYEIQIKGSIEDQMASIQKSEADIFLIPSNLYAKIQNSKGDLKIISPNIGMPLTLIGSKNINSIEDFKGTTISLTGKGAIPEAILRKGLESYGISEDDVNINFIQDPAEAVPLLLKDENSFALLPQPFATALLLKNENLIEAVDIVNLWDKMELPKIITSVIVTKEEVYKEKEEAIQEFLKDYNQGIEELLKDPDKYANTIEEMNIVKAPIAKKSIPNLDFLKYEDDSYKKDLEKFFQVILELNPELIGGKIPIME